MRCNQNRDRWSHRQTKHQRAPNAIRLCMNSLLEVESFVTLARISNERKISTCRKNESFSARSLRKNSADREDCTNERDAGLAELGTDEYGAEGWHRHHSASTGMGGARLLVHGIEALGLAVT